ncbi:MAG: hypothetical protein JNL73_06970 [Anaerolineales bacterium]|nr:hypothetical protein [Anaerolineales bacterium]
MNPNNHRPNLTWILRSAVVLGGLSLAACAPMALPGEDGNQPASAGVAALEQQAVSTAGSTDDSLTPEATHTQMPGETSTATTPEVSRTPQPGTTATAVVGQEVEFTGTIESLDGSTLVVSGRRVIITAQTEVKLQPQKGLNVKVHGSLQADGSVVAREIESVPAGQATHQPGLTTTPRAEGTRQPQGTRQAGETEFYGTVSSINGNVYVVNGLTVVVNGEVKGPIVVGDLVKVHGVTQPDGSVLAREIERADGTRTPNSTQRAGETEFYGTVSSISGNVFVVNGLTVVVNGEIKGAIVVGDQVKVHGVTQPDGSVLAREIERADGDDDNSGRGGDDDGNDDNSGNGGSDDSDDDNSGHGGGDDSDDDNSGHGGDDGDDDNSGNGGDDDSNDGDDDNGGNGGGNDD